MKTIEQTYRVRGKPVQVKELADLAAVRAEGSTHRPPVRRSPLDGLAPAEALPQVRAFEDAGWRFLPREQAADGYRVFVKSGGRIALGTNRLAIRVSESVPPTAAEALLEREGLSVIDRPRFVPNLFIAEVPPGQDVLETARRLDELQEIEFAEPQLIEALSGR